MDIEGKSLFLSIVSPDASLFEGDVSSVQVPSYDGLIGILPNHAPMISVLGFGLITVKINHIIKSYVVDGGFLEVMDNRVTVLANSAVETSDIDTEAARKDFDEAMAQQPQGEYEMEMRQEKLEAARNRLKATAK